MGKVIVVFGLLAICGAFVAGAALAARVDPAPIVLAVATQEAVKADKLRAQAEAERARAAQAWAAADESKARAEAVRASLAQLTFTVQTLAIGLPILALVILAFLGWAGVQYAFRQSHVFYPLQGVSPILAIEQGNMVHLIDTGRNLGGVVTIGDAGAIHLPLAGPAEVHAQLSAQALAAQVIAQSAGSEAKSQAAQAVTKAVQGVLQELPALASGKAAPSVVFTSPKATDGELRVVKRNAPTATPGTVKRGHMAEFLKRGAVVGFGRRDFAGFKFADGEACSQSAWAALSKAARDSGVLVADGPGWKLAGTVEQALERLGLEDLGE